MYDVYVDTRTIKVMNDKGKLLKIKHHLPVSLPFFATLTSIGDYNRGGYAVVVIVSSAATAFNTIYWR